MLKRLVTATALALAIPMTVAIPTAFADTPKCVSKAEFRAVKMGWGMPRVHNRFDIKGQQTYVGYGYQNREYRACTKSYGYHGTVWVDYERSNGKWKVSGKYAAW
ncbi:MAG: hypothetical protein AVDCRST_MAG34-2136 [uncultured Nocardioidaceae bacterium]|uniref:Uncharacterized protein n=1 Tax=uncultured Nocardioidaceae bacterium TaxID=253824 RepID=A0A6J4MD52_9ACTN|nr:MAG: hypothetical protein AVDCRST_MAG34-2136 [uncultured Nocardioidaceae bacterium]